MNETDTHFCLTFGVLSIMKSSVSVLYSLLFGYIVSFMLLEPFFGKDVNMLRVVVQLRGTLQFVDSCSFQIIC